MKCFVSLCESDFHGLTLEPADFSVHRFPKDLQRQLAWLQAISDAENRIINVDAINFSAVRICSKHFTNDDFYFNHGRKMLKKTATPSIFDSIFNLR